VSTHGADPRDRRSLLSRPAGCSVLPGIMKEFFQAGGYSMWLVLLFGGVALVSAVRFAIRPELRKLSGLRALAAAATLAVLSGIAADFTAVMWHVTGRDDWMHSPDVPFIVMRGLGEAVTPATLGFTLLSLTWIGVAVGTRRSQEE